MLKNIANNFLKICQLRRNGFLIGKNVFSSHTLNPELWSLIPQTPNTLPPKLESWRTNPCSRISHQDQWNIVRKLPGHFMEYFYQHMVYSPYWMDILKHFMYNSWYLHIHIYPELWMKMFEVFSKCSCTNC